MSSDHERSDSGAKQLMARHMFGTAIALALVAGLIGLLLGFSTLALIEVGTSFALGDHK